MSQMGSVGWHARHREGAVPSRSARTPPTSSDDPPPGCPRPLPITTHGIGCVAAHAARPEHRQFPFVGTELSPFGSF